MMDGRYKVVSMIGVAVAFCLSFPPTTLAQSRQLRDDVEQLAVDLHAGIDRSTLTEQQKTKLRDDFKELRQARENHQRFAAMRAARSIRATLDSGAFKPEDRDRIKHDMDAIREAHDGGSSSPGMEGRFRRFNQ